jgi:hypothetical protein
MVQGQPLCGPCKNFQVRGLNRPARVTPLAIVSLVVALVSGPVAFVISLIGIGLQAKGDSAVAGAVALCLIGLVLPVLGFVLGAMAWRKIESSPQVGGRAMALTGMIAGAAGVLWTVTVAGQMIVKQMQS